MGAADQRIWRQHSRMEARVLITAEALRRIARRQGLPAGIVEKDYALSWFLADTYKNALLKDALLFKGGTALKKVYFPETWRLSHDLDFTVVGTLKPNTIRQGFTQVFKTITQNNGLVFSLDAFHVTKGSAIASLQFTGPLVHKNRIRIDLTLDEKLLFSPEWKLVTTDYPDLPEFSVNVYGLKEILIEKLRSLFQRGKSRDYYDVWRLLAQNRFDMNEVAKLLIKKCELNDIPYTRALIFDGKQLDDARRHWQQSLGELTTELSSFDDVISDLKKKLVLTSA